jgi:6-phosphogluconolactonase (cycloisomerase 2 family)
MNAMVHRSIFVFGSLLPTLCLAAGCSGAPSSDATASSAEALSELGALASPIHAHGTVVTQTNAADANALLFYSQEANGALSLTAQTATGGAGLGTGLSAQGAIARDGRWLFAVNAGSNDVSTFDLASNPPALVGRAASGGTQPVSVTARDSLVYVLNAGGAGNVAGFDVDAKGALHAIGTSPLSGSDVTPTDVAFAPDGETLVVTEKVTNVIDTYAVDARGDLRGPVVTASNGPAPFGFDFGLDGELFVSEAADSAASAYAIVGTTRLASISASVPNGQSAACWLTAAPDGRYVFTANAGNGTLSSYRVGTWGRLMLESGVAASQSPTSHPVDMAFSPSGQTLYSLANAGTITTYQVDGGSLTRVGAVTGLPASVTGLVAW